MLKIRIIRKNEIIVRTFVFENHYHKLMKYEFDGIVSFNFAIDVKSKYFQSVNKICLYLSSTLRNALEYFRMTSEIHNPYF